MGDLALLFLCVKEVLMAVVEDGVGNDEHVC